MRRHPVAISRCLQRRARRMRCVESGIFTTCRTSPPLSESRVSLNISSTLSNSDTCVHWRGSRKKRTFQASPQDLWEHIITPEPLRSATHYGLWPRLIRSFFCDGDQSCDQRKAEMLSSTLETLQATNKRGSSRKKARDGGVGRWWGGSARLTNKWRLESRVAHRKTSGQWGGLCGSLSSGLGSPGAWLGGPGSRRQKKQNPRPSQGAISRITGPKHCWPGRLLARPETPGLLSPFFLSFFFCPAT